MLNINLPEKLYYSINEVAQAFGVNASLIRFWEKEFEIISPRKTTSGSRKFSADDIQKLKLIYHLVKERGFTLEGARQRLKEEKTKNTRQFRPYREIRTYQTNTYQHQREFRRIRKTESQSCDSVFLFND